MLRIAVQAKGRLNEQSMELLREAGINIDSSKRKLLTRCGDFPVEILYLRDDDIPHAVSVGVADLGIVGMNEVAEKNFELEILEELGFGKCRMSIAIPKNSEYSSSGWLEGKNIATSYPGILSRFLRENGIEANIHEIAGSVEISPAVGLADAIFDIVSSGGTLISNGLIEVEKVMDSQAVLVGKPGITGKSDSPQREILEQLLFRIRAVRASSGMKYVLMNVPQDKTERITSLLPGLKSPTILPLAQDGWCSVHAVIRESELWEKIEKLKAAGAEDILVLSLEKIIS